MQNVWALASIWVGLALVATLLAIWFKISTALSEIVVGTVAQLSIGAIVGPMGLAAKTEWITFLAGTGAIVLTFLAGAELDPVIFRTKWKEATAVGLVGFFGPFLGCTAVAHYVLRWTVMSSWLAGVALSTTSVAVVYAVMLELGLNKTEFGKAILAACFVNDLGTVIALASSDADLRTPHTVLLHTRRVVCICSCATGRTAGVSGFVWSKDGVDDDRPLSHCEIFQISA